MDSSRISDDDFDWEAAVAEIDIACNRTSESTTTSLGSNGNFFESNCKVSKAAKQSTLDKYMRVQKDQSFSTNQNHPLSELQSKKVDVSRHHIDPLAANTWTYPVNVPLRDYQYSIANTALFSNTLVALPTGLGKTLIAAVVMYNYFRWFPSGKIVFTAPSRPLVMQQIEACHNIVGIPQEWTIDMTGQMNPSERSEYWQKMRVFFVTPQVLEKDIQSGSCKGKELVCLVVDEAHRAVGNYSYCVVVRELMALEVDLRILALTATPGSKQASIQTVIDNLNISTLEHRDETDPDVVEYTHNRNIDLIPVTMPKESLNISSLLLSIVEPVVQKLCSLRVFYNRDLTKITPFELLTARDKFRQSPPSFISELQYGEIEGYFGTAVTLYHIYKLLFSHGVRPALEMLHQKLQPGAFARTMGRNEKVWQLKLSMQQNLKHGAPNPKLQKMEEIIKEHFDSNNPATTRVIIFTNFRESVKDIIESLQKLETGVKAVEFIGQSSGKACKGQTQKMQQEVLQKFRAGEFNIIVATSIGEEGLDIMEVDLVICFDANVSPIRMIQRIGRTGRKRDGRVVILASEGSELQGYMTKKAKGKALRKHMHNGGIQSFIFHSSPRMVPHCYQPQAELIEMSIEKFVPRRNKAKAISISKDSVTDSLTEAEANLLAKYFSGERDQHGWKPSLVSFPHCQLFPSRVAKIKHSFRTSEMLVHTLKLLQGQDISKVESQPRNSLDSAEYAVKDFVSQGLQDDDFEFSASLEPYPLYCIPDKTDVEEAENSFIAMEEDRLPNSFRKEVISLDELDTVTGEEVITLKELDTVTRREVIHLKELDTVKNKELKGAHSSEMEKAKTNSSFLETPVLHHCLFNTQYVYVNEEGRVIIKPPPSLPIHKKLATKKADISSDSKNRAPQDVATYSLPVRSFVGEQAGVMLTEIKDNSEEFMNKPSCADKITIGLQNYSLQEPVIDRMHDPYNSTNSQNFPTEKLDEMQHCKTNNNVDKMVGSFEQFGVCSPPRDNQEKNTQKNTRFSRPDNMLSGKPLEDSPKLPSKSLKVISGACRINKASALSDCNGNSVSFGSELKENVVSNCAPDSNGSLLFGHIHGNSDLRNPISNSVLKDSTNHQRRDSRLQRKPSLDDSFLKYDGKMLSAADNIDVSISQMETRNTISNNISYICNNSNDSGVKRSSTYSIEDERQGAVLEALSTPRVSALHTQISPLTIKNTCTQDWRLSIDETQQSGKKQRKFKRLRKVKEDAQKPSSKKNTKKDQHNTDSLVFRKQRISTDRGIPKRTNLPLIDEEAEVSSDEDVSTDEDNESENGSAEETDDSFIDDEIELSTSESDKVDMLAVYRRSLLTQSPFDRNINASVCIENMRDNGNEEQEPPISVDPPFETVCSSGSETMETPYHASFSEDVKCESSSKDLNISYHSRFNVHIQSESGETDKFQELRKRKLDFQSINVTESSNYQGNFSCPANASSIEDVYSQPKHTSEDLIIASLDDDFFTGIDLDALEAEATEKARLRSQMNVGYQQAASMTEPGMPKIRVSFPRSQGADLQSIVNNGSDKNQAIALDENNDFVNNGFPRKRERTEDVDNDFLCIPSFNLGI